MCYRNVEFRPMSDRTSARSFRNCAILILAFGFGVPAALAQVPDNVSDSHCANPTCIYVRAPGEPTDPQYPDYWSSNWTMYRVFKGYAENPRTGPARGAEARPGLRNFQRRDLL
jgi:hypothetical protein